VGLYLQNIQSKGFAGKVFIFNEVEDIGEGNFMEHVRFGGVCQVWQNAKQRNAF
jgi:hypothetical protein